ncbi:MAG TPA: DUF748 domain-containing protein [Methylomirabilota bacterium]|nr:DUF748 domain-containing protein [Methylomirabilota bacterium]
MRTRWKWIVGVLAVVLALAYAIAFLIDEPLRRTTEREMNARLDGYTARIGRLNFHPIGFAVDFHDVVLVQDAHPDPPVMRIPRLSASVQWSAIVRGRVVADFELIGPEIYVDRTHFVRELEDPTPVKDRGWQDALQAMYPLKINEFSVRRGAFTYVDSGQARPLVLRDIETVLNDIRNVRSAPDVYPSPIRLQATVFDDGRLDVLGHADFLRVPHLGVKGRVALERVALDYLRPVAARFGFTVAAGTFGGRGDVEYAPEVKVVDLDEVRVDGLEADYAYRKRTARPVKEAAAKTAEAAKEVANKPGVLLKARRISAGGATVGFVNEEATPRYRVFLADADLVIENFTNQRTEGTATARLDGRFMGSGVTTVSATFRPEIDGPDFDLNASIEAVDLKSMNDLLRAHARVDVVSGVLSVFAEARVKNRRIEGYVKPLFRDLDVYDAAQDADKSFGRKLKEKAADLVGKVLRNRPRDEVATVVPIAGRLDDPETSTWEALIGLVQNAFFKAILPGFERERARALRR